MARQEAQPLSYGRDIRPLFRDFDVASMIKARNLDLSSYQQVRDNADHILQRLQVDMPCDGIWPQKDIDTFRQWINDGKLP